MKTREQTFVLFTSAILCTVLLFSGAVRPSFANHALNHVELTFNETVGTTFTVIDCGVNGVITGVSDTNPGIVTVAEVDCGAGVNESLDLTCVDVGVTHLDVSMQVITFLSVAVDIDVTCTMFVIPESPIGIIALMGSSLAALGGFIFWKRRNKPTDGMTGLGI